MHYMTTLRNQIHWHLSGCQCHILYSNTKKPDSLAPFWMSMPCVIWQHYEARITGTSLNVDAICYTGTLWSHIYWCLSECWQHVRACSRTGVLPLLLPILTTCSCTWASTCTSCSPGPCHTRCTWEVKVNQYKGRTGILAHFNIQSSLFQHSHYIQIQCPRNLEWMK